MKVNKEKIDLIRAEKKLSSGRLCKLAKMSPNTLKASYAKGVDPVIIGRIADALEVPVKAIIFKEKEEVKINAANENNR